MKGIVSHMKGYVPQAVLGIVLTGSVVITELMQPKLMALIVDQGIPSGDMGFVVRHGAMMVGLALIGILCGVGGVIFAAIAATGFGKNIRESIFRKVQQFSFSNINRFSTASLVTRLTNDTNFLQSTALMSLRMMVRAPVMLVGALVMAYITNPGLSVIFLFIIPLLAAAVVYILMKGFPRFAVMQRKTDGLNRTVQENLINVRVVKSFVREDYEEEKFNLSNEDLMQASMKASGIVILVGPAMMLLLNVATISVMWFGAGKIVSGSGMQVGDLMVFLNYMMQTLMSLLMLSMTLMMFSRSKASAQRIREVLDAHVDIQDPENGEDWPVADGSVEFRDVSFSYDRAGGEPVLRHVSFRAEPGQTIGIIGATGSGKSTLVQLISRLYDPSEGTVFVGGRDVRTYKLDTLRGAVGMVLQKNLLFSGTIEENVKWGNENAEIDEVRAVCADACADEFILSFPEGYQTELGQGGVNLSGGQKQRVCIARAMLKRPPVLVLDDSTSALDAATEGKIKQTFREKLSGVTVLLISQKISSVCDADKILVLDDGAVAGFGTHAELMAGNAIYQEIYNSQQRREASYVAD